MTAAATMSTGRSARVSAVLVDELRAIVDNREARQAHSVIAQFVARHGLTQDDIDALVAALARPPIAAVADLSPAETGPAEAGPADSSLAETGPPEPAGEQGGSSWMFDEDPAPPVPSFSDGVVGQAFEDLLGDWTRTGKRLTRGDVSLLATRRNLSAEQVGELLGLLADAGVELPASAGAGPVRSAAKGDELHADTVRQYLRQIGRYPLIGAAREVELWSLMKQGVAAQAALDAGGAEASGADLPAEERRSLRARVAEGQRAHSALVCANLRLVVSMAKAGHYDRSGVEFADRIQDGNMGLMHAAHLFDGSLGYKFSTYATWWIRQYIERGIADRGRTIRIPVYVHQQVQKIRKVSRQLADRLDREPTLGELADATGMEPGRVRALLELGQPVRSIDMLLGEEGDLRLSDVLVHEEERDARTDPATIVEQAMMRDDIDRVLRNLLSDRAADIVRRRFGLGTGEEETFDGISADYGVTRERIRQIQTRAMRTLQESSEALALRSYLIDEREDSAPAERKTR